MLTGDKRIRTILQLSEVYGWRCWYCNHPLRFYLNEPTKPKIKAKWPERKWPREIKLHLDHIVPVARGGSDHISNLSLSCEYCNRAKGNQSLERFLAWLERVKFSSPWTPIKDGRPPSKVGA